MSAQEEITYDALDFDGTERSANYRTIAYREDMLHVLDKKDAAAIIYQIVYRWLTEYKREEAKTKIERRKKQGLPPYTQQEIDNMLWVRMSYNDFVRESGGAVGYNTVIRMLDYLLNTKKVLEQRPSTEPQYADFEYRVNKSEVSKLLKELPGTPAFKAKWSKKKKDSTQMGTPEEEVKDASNSTHLGTDSTHLGTDSTHLGTEVYPSGYPTHNTHITTHIEHTEEENALSSIDETRTPSSSNSSPSITESVASETQSQPLTDTTAPLTAEDGTTEPATPKNASQREDVPTKQTGEQSSKQAESPIVNEDTGKSSGNGNSNKTIKLTPEQAERRRTWQERINDNRGGPLRKKGLCINETTCLAELVSEFNDEQIEFIFTYATKTHWKFKANPHEVGGKDLLDMSRPVVKLMKEPAQQEQNGNLKEQKDTLQRKNIVDTGSRVLVPPRLTREQLKATEQEAV